MVKTTKIISLFLSLIFASLVLSNTERLEGKLDRNLDSLMKKVVAWRHDIHQYPELSNREFKTAAKVAKELHKNAKAHGFGFLDAPVSGGQAGAEKGALTVMVGGDKEDFDKAKHIIDCYSKKVQLLGPSGSGQLAKMVNQICIAGLVQGLSEALNFGLNAGLKMEDVIEVISKGAAQSWQMDNRHKTMIDDKFDFGFAVDWMRKDLKIALDEAKKNNSPLPITKIIDGYYKDIQKMGGNRWDTSSLIRRFKKNK